MDPASLTKAPRFLQRLYSAEEKRRQRDGDALAVKQRAKKQHNGHSESGSTFLAALDGESSLRTREASLSSEATNVVPSLTYASSAASASSSEPHSFRTDNDSAETETEGTVAFRRNASSFLYGYATDFESSGYSSEDSRSASPTSKSAFASPAFPGNYDFSPLIHNSSPYHHGQQHKSQQNFNLQLQQNTPQFNLQPLSLGPPSLALSGTPVASTSALNSTPYDSSAAIGEDVFIPPSPSIWQGESLQPPDNFAMVYSAVYRSSFPSKKHYSFLKSLNLKTVLTLVPDEYPDENRDFFRQEGITFHQIGMPGNKEPFVIIPDEKIRQALAIVLDKRNHPLLIHCNKGKHRTGCLVGCLRKMQCWSTTAVFDEYRKFSYPKSRAMDQLFIELFQPDWNMIDHAHLPDWCLGEDGGGSPGLLSPTRTTR